MRKWLKLLCCMLVVLCIGEGLQFKNLKAASLFDGAIELEPLKLAGEDENQFYKIVIDQRQTITFLGGSSPDQQCVEALYKPDGTMLESGNVFLNYVNPVCYDLDAGIYYIKFSSVGYYVLSNPASKQDMTVAENRMNTIYNDYTELSPLEIFEQDCSLRESKVYSFSLSEAKKVKFYRNGQSWMNWNTVILTDKYGRILHGFFELYDLDLNLDEGTYYLIICGGITNGYYVVSDPDEATGVTLNSTKVSLSIGQSTTLKYTLSPAKCIDSVTWKSTDENVASVDENGKITAKLAGKCVVSITTGSGKATLCEVIVKKSSTIKLKKAIITVKKGKKRICSAVIKKGKKLSLKISTSSKGKLSLSKLTKKQKKIASVTFKRGKIKIKGKKKGRISLKITSAKTSKYKMATKTIKISIQ